MIRFECDYTEGAHPQIMKRLMETNMEQTQGYGMDPHCEKAREYIKNVCQAPDADVHFLVGGTQTNTTVIAAALRPYQGVIAAQTGHINVHETGAIESTGHKVLALPSEDGTLTAKQIEQTMEAHFNDSDHEHIVQPGMVYISHPTENGTLYGKQQLEEISEVCKKYQIPLFVDGARMGYGLHSPKAELTLADFARLTDVFYIGGTKVGALFGEAVVITNNSLKKDFRYFIKQRGGMLAKGRLLGIQFETLFEPIVCSSSLTIDEKMCGEVAEDCLYNKISKHAIGLAMKIKEAFAEKGIKFLFDSYTNQQFPILNQKQYEYLKEKYAFCFWCKVDKEHSAVRFCTSWATDANAVALLIQDIKSM